MLSVGGVAMKEWLTARGIYSREVVLVRLAREGGGVMAEFDFDNMTPKQIRKWGETLSHHAQQFGEIRATLIVNCKEGRVLRKLGIVYDEKRGVLPNLVHILQQLVGQVEKKREKDVMIIRENSVPSPGSS